MELLRDFIPTAIELEISNYCIEIPNSYELTPNSHVILSMAAKCLLL